MKSIFKISICVVVAYFTINWIADNPQNINKARQHMNDSVSTGKKKIGEALN